ncbi:cache domain-containing protein [Candidatus Woesebacteria bacterium]|nr:MAG: cache domain-containing protein [Candidatus Woesebacteria bacterium]
MKVKKLKKLLVSISEFSAKRLNLALAITSGIFLVVASGLYVWSHYSADKALTNQMLHRQQVIARSGAESIEHLFRATIDSITLLSEREELLTPTERQSALDRYLANWKHFSIVGVFLTDEDGTIVVNSSNVGSKLVGQSISERDYFKQAIREPKGEVFVSKPFISEIGNVAGDTILTFSIQVYDENGDFTGILTSVFLLNDVVNAYLDPLRISDATRISLLAPNGDFWYSQNIDLIDKNIYAVLDNFNFPGKSVFISKLTSGLNQLTEGKLDIVRPLEESEGVVIERSLIAYSPINYQHDNYLYLIVSNPADEAFQFDSTYKAMNFWMVIVVVAVVLAFSFFVVLVVRVAQRDSYIEGYIYGRDQMVHKPKEK